MRGPSVTHMRIRHGKKTTLLHEQGLSQNYFTQNGCVNYSKTEFATKQRKMYLTTPMSQIGPPQNYRGKINVVKKNPYFSRKK